MAKSAVHPFEFAEIQSLSIQAANIANLLIWINEARALIDNVQAFADIDPKLADCLKGHGVGFNSAIWDDDATGGMAVLIATQRTAVSEIARRSGLMAKGGAA